MDELLESEDAVVFVAITDGDVVGYITGSIREYPETCDKRKYGYISDTSVTADSRGKGVGELLYKKILKWFESKGMDRVELRLHSKNTISVSFWEKQGFKEYLKTLYLDLNK